MSSAKRRKERYANDETYRERLLREQRERREEEKVRKEKLRRLRGWSRIGTCPDNLVILIFDPKIFWPIVAILEDGHWRCLHYTGPEPRPTHWRHIPEVPLDGAVTTA